MENVGKKLINVGTKLMKVNKVNRSFSKTSNNNNIAIWVRFVYIAYNLTFQQNFVESMITLFLTYGNQCSEVLQKLLRITELVIAGARVLSSFSHIHR